MRDFTGEDLRRPLRLPDQPSGTQQRIAADESEAAQEAEYAEEAERTPGEHARLHRHAVDQPAKHETLAKRRQNRTARKSDVPKHPETHGLQPEGESDPAEDEREEHEHDGQIEGRQQGIIAGWKDSEEQRSTHHEPGFIGVPNRLDA